MRRVVCALAVLVASCAGQRPTLEDESAAREVDTTTSVPTEREVVDGETFRLAFVGDWTGDPADAGPASLTSRVIADLLFEGVTRLGADGQPEPGLAERWFVSDDRLTWTFVFSAGLRDGLGGSITARDIKHSLEAVAARGATDQAAIALTAVTGWDDRMNGSSGGVAGLSAPDATTLVIQLDDPFELLPSVLAAPSFGITGTTDDDRTRTTGPYRYSEEEDNVLLAVDPEATVQRVELVRTATDPSSLVEDGLVDWAVLPPDASGEDLQADVLRQPLELEVALVARNRNRSERLGLLALIEPLLLATEIPALSPRATAPPDETGTAPGAALVDIPEGIVEPIGHALVGQLEEAGISVLSVTADPAAFADRVSRGDAVLFPIVIAGGTGTYGGLLHLATPGGVDDFFGPESDTRAELAAAVVGTTDPLQRDLFAEALERELIDDGYLLPVGVFEVRVAVGDSVTGLRHRSDGTIDLDEVSIDRSAPG